MAEVKVYSFIGKKRNSYDQNDYMSGQQFCDALATAEATADTEIKVSINSGGGSVTDGYAMISAMKKSGKSILAVIDGYAASMGYYICLGAAKITAAENSIIMLHSVQGSASGSPEDLIAEAEVLKKFNATIAPLLAARTGLTEAEVTEKYLGKEVWFTAQEALAAKLIDAIEEYAAENIPAVSAGMSYEEAEMKYAAMHQTNTRSGLLEDVKAFIKNTFGLAEKEKKAALSEAEENGLLCVLSGVKWATDDAESFLKNTSVSPEVKTLLEKVSKANAAFVVEIVNKVYGEEQAAEVAEARTAELIAKADKNRTADVSAKAEQAAATFIKAQLEERDQKLAAASAEIENLKTENAQLKAAPGASDRKPIIDKDAPKGALSKEDLEAKFFA